MRLLLWRARPSLIERACHPEQSAIGMSVSWIPSIPSIEKSGRREKSEPETSLSSIHPFFLPSYLPFTTSLPTAMRRSGNGGNYLATHLFCHAATVMLESSARVVPLLPRCVALLGLWRTPILRCTTQRVTREDDGILRWYQLYDQNAKMEGWMD
jgi:hypothetical protein